MKMMEIYTATTLRIINNGGKEDGNDSSFYNKAVSEPHPNPPLCQMGGLFKFPPLVMKGRIKEGFMTTSVKNKGTHVSPVSIPFDLTRLALPGRMRLDRKKIK